MIELNLASYLKSRPDVANIVGDRVYINKRPKDTKSPAIMLTRIAGNRTYSLMGEIDCVEPLIRLDCFARGNNASTQLDRLFEAVRLEISGQRGTWDGVEVLQCIFQNEGIESNYPIDRSDKWTDIYGVDLRIIHRQTATALSAVEQPAAALTVLRLSSGAVLRLSTGNVLNIK